MPKIWADGIVEVVDCDIAEEFLDYLQLRNSRWLPYYKASSSWVFRGQKRSDWKLEPSATREKGTRWFAAFKAREYQAILLRLHSLLEKPNLPNRLKPFIDDRAIISDLMLQLWAEIYAVREFVEFADQVGHPIPEDKTWDYIERIELAEIFGNLEQQEFRNLMSPVSIEWALAQHHGVPTRLLDWTYKSFAAAFFALEEALNECINKEKSEELDYKIAVWAIDTSALSHTDLRVVTHRRFKVGYLSAQGGLFIYDHLANDHFINTGSWRDFETAIAASDPAYSKTGILRKVTLPTSQATELLRLLMAEGITRAHLMPTYDNVAEALRMKRLLNNIT